MIGFITVFKLDLILRLISALLVGLAVGLERQLHQRVAGTRTNALVAAGAAASDPALTRAAAGVLLTIAVKSAGAWFNRSFAIATTCARAQAMLRTDETTKNNLLALADYFCSSARHRIDRLFYSIKHNVDLHGYKLAQRVVSGELGWLEEGIV